MAGKTKTKKVQFELLAPEAQEVYLAGDFNNWDSSVNLMKKGQEGAMEDNSLPQAGKI